MWLVVVGFVVIKFFKRFLFKVSPLIILVPIGLINLINKINFVSTTAFFFFFLIFPSWATYLEVGYLLPGSRSLVSRYRLCVRTVGQLKVGPPASATA